MPEEITQRLGFDASRAIEELRKLQSQLNQFKQGLQSTSGALRKFPSNATPAIKTLRELSTAATQATASIQGLGQAGVVPGTVSASAQTAANSMGNLSQQAQLAGRQIQTSVTQSFNQASQATDKLGQSTKQASQAVQQASQSTSASANKVANSMNKAGQAGQKAANLITLSWKTVIRVVQAQVIVRAISAIVSAFSESQSAAIEFSQRIGEVATIAGGALGPLDEISASVIEFSRNMGIAAEEVAEGTYQVLSNQVVEAGEALRFEEQAAKLAIATHSELREAVNALSSVMNSYNLDISETERVSDVLFKTIELGRLRLGEFGDVLGRVTPLTAALGISVEEMSAALATLTQKGVPAHTAITQLTQVSQKLLRPTTALQALYEKWGVETGPEAIRRFGGLAGVLIKMKDETAGNDKEFADLLGRVRAMVGALNLTTNSGEAFTEAIEEMRGALKSTEKAYQEMEGTIGRRAVKAWNDLEASVLEFGHTLLELTTPIIEGLNVLVKNFDLVAAGLIGAGTAALVMSGKLTIATFSMTSLTASVVALKAAFFTLIPILAAVVIAIGIAYGIRALKDSLDTATELAETHKNRIEDLTKTQEEATKRRIEATRKEFEERRKITGEFFSETSKAYRKHFEDIEISSKVVGKTLDAALSELMDKRRDAVELVKDAVLDADDAIKDSMEVVAKTQESIANDAFEREKRHMTARQQLWAEIERAQATAAEARRAYSEAGADEEKIRDAREKSNLAEKRAEEAVAHAERLGNYADLKRAEDELDKIRSDRLKAEGTFQLERKQLQQEVHQDRLRQLEEEGVKLELLVEKIKELSDPLTSEGVLKSIEQRRADAERISELAPEIEKQLDTAFDFSMYERLGVAESMQQVGIDLQAALDQARIDWGSIIADFEAQLTSKSYEASVRISIENEYIIEEFVKRFGEIDPLGDPGKLGSQMEQIFEDIVQRYENLNATVENQNQAALTNIEGALEKLQSEEFFNFWDNYTQKATFSLDSVSQAYQGAAGASEEYLVSQGKQIPVAEQLRLKLIEAANTVKKVVDEQRQLTVEEEKSLNAVLQYAKELERAGQISKNQSDVGTKAWKDIVAAVEAATKAAEAYKEQSDIPPGTYEDALNALEQLRQKAEEAAASQGEIANEADQTEGEIDAAKQAIIEMPSATSQATQALAQGTEQARQLKIELQGATQAQRELSQAQAQQPGTPAGPAQPAPPEKTKEELEAQAAAARQLTEEMVRADNQFNAVFTSINNVTQAMVGTSEAAIQIANSMENAFIAVDNMQFSFAAVVEQIATGVELAGQLVTSINDSANATDIASQAAANWAGQLNNCAAAANSAASAMRAAASAAQAAAAACASASAACSGGSASAYYGGHSAYYRQAGGLAVRGQDRIPIMAAPGEFIVSARNARRFASQLQAMNAGREPIYRDRGGPITNIGDINVNMSGRLDSETPQQTAREIAVSLRRELRRKTSRLQN